MTPMFEIAKKCPHCDTPLEFPMADGRRLVFTAHDEMFCQKATRERVRMLQQALVAQRETYKHYLERYRRDVDKLLVEHGLPTVAELSNQADLQDRMLLATKVPAATDRAGR